ncbi:hypothetical protein [Lysobacter enzymogenes]
MPNGETVYQSEPCQGRSAKVWPYTPEGPPTQA